MSRFRFTLLLILVCSFALTLHAQESSAQKTAPAAQAAAAPPAAKPADVASVDAIMAAVYDVISGPAGARDWDRFNSLFAPGARLIPISAKKDGSGFGSYVMSAKDYSDRAGDFFLKNGFFEREAFRKTERFANIVQIFSTYESRHDAKDEKPFTRGINSFQLYNDGSRWWVVSIMWQEESAEYPIPKEFLPAGK
jgi:hypothetical protein